MTDGLAEGVVIENHGALFDVLVDGRVVRCLLRGRLKKDKRRTVAPVAAGDRVSVRLLQPGSGVIEAVLPREADLSRTATGGEPLQQTLVANVDQAVIVFAAAEPRTDCYLLDRFLVAVTAAGLDAAVCINKCDLAERAWLDAAYALYGRMGYRVLYTSALNHRGIEELRDVLKDGRSVICGPSGVGKSSLLNALDAGLSLRTAEVGEVTHKGRHATTSVSLLPLPFGGWIADTPGLRQLAFWQVSPDQVAAGFPDLQPYLGRCQFANCSHRAEPGCALRAAAKQDRIAARRLQSFLQMGGR
jgi:ribosome biogenesis GTPase